MKSLSVQKISQESNLPATKGHSLEFTKGFLQAVEQNNPIQAAKIERSVTVQDAITGISLRNAIKESSEDLIISGLISLIIRTSNFFNIGKPMNEDQAIETAYLLLDKYPHESFEDFVIMFRNAKTGKYGELYNRLDGQIIFKWMGEYLEEKAAHREKLHRAVKFGQEQTDLAQTIQTHAKRLELGETEKNNIIGKPVIEALKEGIGWEQFEKQEKSYEEFRKEFFMNQMQKNNSKNTQAEIE